MMHMDRQLLTTIAAVVAVVACIYLFREMKQAKDDVDGLKMVQSKMMHMLAPPPQPQPQPQPRPYGMPMPPPPPPPSNTETATAPIASETETETDEIVQEK